MAKTFYTNGTGSQQTLTGSQDEKVAVYQTLADAEADLANLEAGQIVATPDTGDELAQPVDEVTSGNMHSVTSNAVYTAIGGSQLKTYKHSKKFNNTSLSTYGYITFDIPAEITRANVLSVLFYTGSVYALMGTQLTAIDVNNSVLYVTYYKPTNWAQAEITFSYIVTYIV